MPESEFDKPVRVALGPNGSVAYTVTTPTQAAERLLTDWPAPVGKTERAARVAVLQALENARDASLTAKARAAFEAAAEEAGILLPGASRPNGGKSFKWGKRKGR